MADSSSFPHDVAAIAPLAYDELRKIAAGQLAHERPGQTLNATALVHEAYVRLVSRQSPAVATGGLFVSRAYFFAAAAEAMRRILVENARRKARVKHGGLVARVDLEPDQLAGPTNNDELLDLHDALEALADHDPLKAKLVELRYFAGLTLPEAAECLGISPSTADRAWRYARAWLYAAMENPKRV